MAQEDKIRKILKQLLIDEPFWGNILIQGEIVEDKNIPIAAMLAKGEQLYFLINPDTFWHPRFTDAHRVAILKHEVMHAALLHPLRARKNNIPHQAWNICCDLEVNSYIPDLNYHDPEKKIKFLFAEDFGLDVKKTAEWYHANMPRGKGNGQKDKDKMIWDYKDDSQDNNESDNNGPSDNQSKSNDTNNAKPAKSSDQTPQQQGAGQAQTQHKHWETFTPYHKDIMKKVIDRASRMAGKTPGEFKEILDRLYSSKLNWRWIFQRAATRGTMKSRKEKFTWARLNKRDDRLKGKKRLRMPDIICAVDTSGSMSTKDLTDCFAEINKLTKIARSLWLIQFDTRINYCKRVKKLNSKALEAYGRGGTNFEICFDYIENDMIKKQKMKKPLVIVLTDGEDDEGHARKTLKDNLIWIVMENRNIEKSWGKVIPLPQRN